MTAVYPPAIISRNVPYRQPLVGQQNHLRDHLSGMIVSRNRLLLGWTHQNDNPNALERGKIWCEVTGCGMYKSFRIYDEAYNRSPVPGDVRFCGTGNFTMCRMFHPFWAINGRPPQDMASGDKNTCRTRWLQFTKEWRRQHGLPTSDDEPDEPDQPNAPEDSDESDDSEIESEMDSPRPSPPPENVADRGTSRGRGNNGRGRGGRGRGNIGNGANRGNRGRGRGGGAGGSGGGHHGNGDDSDSDSDSGNDSDGNGPGAPRGRGNTSRRSRGGRARRIVQRSQQPDMTPPPTPGSGTESPSGSNAGTSDISSRHNGSEILSSGIRDDNLPRDPQGRSASVETRIKPEPNEETSDDNRMFFDEANPEAEAVYADASQNREDQDIPDHEPLYSRRRAPVLTDDDFPELRVTLLQMDQNRQDSPPPQRSPDLTPAFSFEAREPDEDVRMRDASNPPDATLSGETRSRQPPISSPRSNHTLLSTPRSGGSRSTVPGSSSPSPSASRHSHPEETVIKQEHTHSANQVSGSTDASPRSTEDAQTTIMRIKQDPYWDVTNFMDIDDGEIVVTSARRIGTYDNPHVIDDEDA